MKIFLGLLGILIGVLTFMLLWQVGEAVLIILNLYGLIDMYKFLLITVTIIKVISYIIVATDD